MILNGELASLRDEGITGVTSNPSIFQAAISSGNDYDDQIFESAQRGVSPSQIFEEIAVADIRDACEIFRPVYQSTTCADGYVSLEVSPNLAYDTDGTMDEARRLWNLVDRPNLMIKVPGTAEGVPAFKQLIAEGINVNVTLLFSVERYKEVALAYVEGLQQFENMGGNLSQVASVASFFVSRVDTAVDALLEKKGNKNLQGKAAVANAQLAYAEFEKIFKGSQFEDLIPLGARMQRCLWASTSTKNPLYPDTMYVSELVACDTVNTMPIQTIDAWRDSGNFNKSMSSSVLGAQVVMDEIRSLGIDVTQITDKLEVDGVKAFSDSYTQLLLDVERKAGDLVGS
tara:strand:- start:3262 stop:4290 length:1029 start_codon:yes stop_codon:yes gene_type:complete